MAKKVEGHSHGCCGGNFFWGVLAGLVLAVVLHVVCMKCCHKSMSDCRMAARGTAQAEKGAPAR
ncbi:MAG: hypothetical protein AAB152_04645 [Candidatus Coatesbacteria bacterium]